MLDMLVSRVRPSRAAGTGAGGTAALAAAATVLLPAAGIVAASTLGDESDGGDGAKDGSQTRNFAPHVAEGPLAQPFASDPEAVSGYAVARITRGTTLYSSPGGKRKIRIPAKTEWARSGSGRHEPEGRVGGRPGARARERRGAWLRTSEAQLRTVPWSLHVDLSNHRLTVRKDGRGGATHHHRCRLPWASHAAGALLRHRQAEGRRRRFALRLLRARHERTPERPAEGWPGGDRVAFHATSDLSSIGQWVSLGCMRATSDNARWLIETIPLGAPVSSGRRPHKPPRRYVHSE